ncbi:MAG: ABC transporter ATP-binding protein [Planctomycetota bacterium]|jgi:putative ABC transport system ATP-binding protein
MSDPVLTVAEVRKAYRSGAATIEVLRGVSMTAAAGEMVAVIGPSGSGKSTLLACLAGLEDPDAGSVTIAGTVLQDVPPEQRARFRGANIGFVFQSYRLLPALSAEENVRVPLELQGRSDAAAQARDWLQRLGLGERLRHRPAQLSGGEQQRVALARALVTRPHVVFADEPTGNLDQATAEQIVPLLCDLPRDQGSALIYVTHDPALAARADRVLRMDGGRLVPA